MTETGPDGLLEAYLHHLAHERRLSSNTLSNYRRDLTRVGDWLAEAKRGTWDRLDQQGVRGYVAWRHRGGASGTTLQRELSALRSLYRYLLREGLVGQNPAQGVRAPKSARKLPSTLDADQLCGLLDHPDDDPLALRDTAMVELFYSSGLRLAELVSIDLGDVDMDDATLEVTGKGAKTRRVPVGGQAREAIKRWIRVRGNYTQYRREGPVRQSARQPHPSTHRAAAPAALGDGAGSHPQRPPPPASSFIRQPLAGVVRRSARSAGATRTLGHQHDADLHPSGLPAPGPGLRQGAPAGKEERDLIRPVPGPSAEKIGPAAPSTAPAIPSETSGSRPARRL